MLKRALSVPKDYPKFLKGLKERIRKAQVKAALSVNSKLVMLYWDIGRDILNRQKKQGWGSKVIERLSRDLKASFPHMKGFSTRNLVYMQTFARAWPRKQFTQQVAAQIPWHHNCVILDKITSPQEREWYIHAVIEYGWSRPVLVHQIEKGLYKREGKAITNFSRNLPKPQSELAQQILKDPYNFDFLNFGKDVEEKELERGLLEHLKDFLVELGVGFAFVGSQYHLEVGGDDFYIDLLFYHLRLRCYVIIELKATKFQPEYAGKMNFYLSAVDDLLCHPNDKSSIGIILCKTKNRVIAEYSLRDHTCPP
ncbi:DUF1016 family protein [bacterium]|nr:DUF1016 family protein [bacterium]